MEERPSHINSGEIGMMLLTNNNYKDLVEVEMGSVTFRIHSTIFKIKINHKKILLSHHIVTQMLLQLQVLWLKEILKDALQVTLLEILF